MAHLDVGARERFGHVLVRRGARKEPHRQVEQQHGHRAEREEEHQVRQSAHDLAVGRAV